jgi:hypothetical protein
MSFLIALANLYTPFVNYYLLDFTLNHTVLRDFLGGCAVYFEVHLIGKLKCILPV